MGSSNDGTMLHPLKREDRHLFGEAGKKSKILPYDLKHYIQMLQFL